MALALARIGTTHYLLDDNDRTQTWQLTYPQYQAFTDFLNARVDAAHVRLRVEHYRQMDKPAVCPFCDQGTLKRSTVKVLVELGEDGSAFHDSLIHGALV